MPSSHTPSPDFSASLDAVLGAHQSAIAADRSAAAAETARLTKGWSDFAAALASLRAPVLEPLFSSLNDRVGPLRPEITKDIDGIVIRLSFPRDDAHPADAALALTIAHDADFGQVLFHYTFGVIPTFITCEPAQDFATPLHAPDHDAVKRWLGERLLASTKSYLEMQHNPHYQKRETVIDPVLKESFPKHLAVASVEVGGATFYFKSDDSKLVFEAEPAKFINRL